jgi:hypothetical protein
MISNSNSLPLAFVQMATRRAALRMEVAGMTRRGRSAYSICKSEYGLRGSKASVLDQMNAMVEAANPSQPIRPF